MPNTKGTKSIVIRKEIVPRLESSYQRFLDPDSPIISESFSAFVNRVLRNYLDKEEFVLRQFPEIEKIAIEENKVYLKDRAIKPTIEVILENKELFCINDESFNCKHVKFVFSIPESGKLHINAPSEKAKRQH